MQFRNWRHFASHRRAQVFHPFCAACGGSPELGMAFPGVEWLLGNVAKGTVSWVHNMRAPEEMHFGVCRHIYIGSVNLGGFSVRTPSGAPPPTPCLCNVPPDCNRTFQAQRHWGTGPRIMHGEAGEPRAWMAAVNPQICVSKGKTWSLPTLHDV
jgi:hypothetical protein